jgi:predicted metal-dependent HD superfamily phosphohydrolase
VSSGDGSTGRAGPSGLHARWDALCARIGAFKAADESDLTFEMLGSLYAHPPRAYHNLGHIDQVLQELDGAAMLAEDPDVVEFSVWMHDCVYYPLRSDNEDRSADAAAMIAGLLGCAAGFVERARACIHATRHSKTPGRGDPALVADLDLTILGEEAGVYDAYRRAIRREYGFVDDDQFIPGRRAFVQRMLDKERIYATPHFRRRLEDAARANLYRELDDLDAGNAPG